ncbi:unnamed protein product [Leptosia nina]|uniref:ZAD domain-containing protein n=1 Tax=Leptosia nina TaxID=320188 RepID=A0AAV1JJH7_9NEOP
MLKNGVERGETLGECRACLQPCTRGETHELFKCWDQPWFGMEETIAEDLIKLTSIQILDTDVHSKVICHPCYVILQKANEFIQTVRKSDLLLSSRCSNNESRVCDTNWPKPIQVDKNLHLYDNVEIKEELLSDEEYIPGGGSNECEFSNVEVKIEEDWQEQSPHINGVLSLSHLNEEMAKINGCVSESEVNSEWNNVATQQTMRNGLGRCKDLDDINENTLEMRIKDEPNSDPEMESTASDISLECFLCSKSFLCISGLKAHVIAQHSYKTVKRKSSDTDENQLKYTCKTCQRRFMTSTDLMVHETCHSKCICYECNSNFETFNQLTKHKCKTVNVKEVGKVLKLEDVQRMANVAHRILEVMTKYTIFCQDSESGNIDECYQALLALITQKEESTYDVLSDDDDISWNASDIEPCDDVLNEYDKNFFSNINYLGSKSFIDVETTNSNDCAKDINSDMALKILSNISPVVRLTRLRIPGLCDCSSADSIDSYENVKYLDSMNMKHGDDTHIPAAVDEVEKQNDIKQRSLSDSVYSISSNDSTSGDNVANCVIDNDNNIDGSVFHTRNRVYNEIARKILVNVRSLDSTQKDKVTSNYDTTLLTPPINQLDTVSLQTGYDQIGTKSLSKCMVNSNIGELNNEEFCIYVSDHELHLEDNELTKNTEVDYIYDSDDELHLEEYESDMDTFSKYVHREILPRSIKVVEEKSDLFNLHSLGSICTLQKTDNSKNVPCPSIQINKNINSPSNLNLNNFSFKKSANLAVKDKDISQISVENNIVEKESENCCILLIDNDDYVNKEKTITPSNFNKSEISTNLSSVNVSSDGTKCNSSNVTNSKTAREGLVSNIMKTIKEDVYLDNKYDETKDVDFVTFSRNEDDGLPHHMTLKIHNKDNTWELPRIKGKDGTFTFRHKLRRELLLGCSNLCLYKCGQNFTYKQRLRIFSNFWRRDTEAQETFLNRYVHLTLRKYVPTSQGNRNIYRHKFMFPKLNKIIRVCKKFFECTLALTMLNRKKDQLSSKKKRNKSDPEDCSEQKINVTSSSNVKTYYNPRKKLLNNENSEMCRAFSRDCETETNRTSQIIDTKNESRIDTRQKENEHTKSNNEQQDVSSIPDTNNVRIRASMNISHSLVIGNNTDFDHQSITDKTHHNTCVSSVDFTPLDLSTSEVIINNTDSSCQIIDEDHKSKNSVEIHMNEGVDDNVIGTKANFVDSALNTLNLDKDKTKDHVCNQPDNHHNEFDTNVYMNTNTKDFDEMKLIILDTKASESRTDFHDTGYGSDISTACIMKIHPTTEADYDTSNTVKNGSDVSESEKAKSGNSFISETLSTGNIIISNYNADDKTEKGHQTEICHRSATEILASTRINKKDICNYSNLAIYPRGIVGKGYKFIFKYKISNTLMPGCTYCRYKCIKRISQQQRRILFDKFWTMTKDAQRNFLNNHVYLINPLKHFKKGTRRKLNHSFYLPVLDQRIQVCKKFFINTLSILMVDIDKYFNNVKVLENRMNPYVKLTDIKLDKNLLQVDKNNHVLHPGFSNTLHQNNTASNSSDLNNDSKLCVQDESYGLKETNSLQPTVKPPNKCLPEAAFQQISLDIDNCSSNSEIHSPKFAQMSIVDSQLTSLSDVNVCNELDVVSNTQMQKADDAGWTPWLIQGECQDSGPHKEEMQSFKDILEDWAQINCKDKMSIKTKFDVFKSNRDSKKLSVEFYSNDTQLSDIPVLSVFCENIENLIKTDDSHPKITEEEVITCPVTITKANSSLSTDTEDIVPISDTESCSLKDDMSINSQNPVELCTKFVRAILAHTDEKTQEDLLDSDSLVNKCQLDHENDQANIRDIFVDNRLQLNIQTASDSDKNFNEVKTNTSPACDEFPSALDTNHACDVDMPDLVTPPKQDSSESDNNCEANARTSTATDMNTLSLETEISKNRVLNQETKNKRNHVRNDRIDCKKRILSQDNSDSINTERDVASVINPKHLKINREIIKEDSDHSSLLTESYDELNTSHRGSPSSFKGGSGEDTSMAASKPHQVLGRSQINDIRLNQDDVQPNIFYVNLSLSNPQAVNVPTEAIVSDCDRDTSQLDMDTNDCASKEFTDLTEASVYRREKALHSSRVGVEFKQLSNIHFEPMSLQTSVDTSQFHYVENMQYTPRNDLVLSSYDTFNYPSWNDSENLQVVANTEPDEGFQSFKSILSDWASPIVAKPEIKLNCPHCPDMFTDAYYLDIHIDICHPPSEGGRSNSSDAEMETEALESILGG